MLIKFKAPDPRAGTIVRMDSSRGQDFIDCAAADLMDEAIHAADTSDASADVPEDVQPAATKPATPRKKK